MPISQGDKIRVQRLKNNPIIRPDMLPGTEGESINGPSLIRVPNWIERPLGKYYLYFAHHCGSNIRLAYADELTGPWQIHPPGTLQLAETACQDIWSEQWIDTKHIASPDVHLDEKRREFRMYFHGPVYAAGPRLDAGSYLQLSMVATSQDGLQFKAQTERLGNSYFRVFEWYGATYALGMPGIFYRSEDGFHDFIEGPQLFTEQMRHSAVKIVDHELWVFYTIVGEAPERILLSTVDLRPPWCEWQATEPAVIFEPEMDWEGADLPLKPSVRGMAHTRLRELRDPAIFTELDRTYLLYAVAGEAGIAIAELFWPR
jgi:hypothetical protein